MLPRKQFGPRHFGSGGAPVRWRASLQCFTVFKEFLSDTGTFIFCSVNAFTMPLHAGHNNSSFDAVSNKGFANSAFDAVSNNGFTNNAVDAVTMPLDTGHNNNSFEAVANDGFANNALDAVTMLCCHFPHFLPSVPVSFD